MLRIGVVAVVDAATVRAKVTFPDLGSGEAGRLMSDWLPVLQHGSTADQGFWVPNVGAQVACVMVDEGLEDGVILGSMFNVDDPPAAAGAGKWYKRFADGSFIEFDPAQGFTISTGLTVRISAASIELNP